MFSTKLSRAAHRATANQCAAAISASSSTACAAARPPSYQRRPSSSKTSCPPDNNASKAAPAAKADGAEATEAPVTERALPQKNSKSRSRGGYKRVGQGQAGNGGVAGSKQGNAEPVDQFAGLPSVPSLHGLDLKDLWLSTFFSLHRPISVTTPVPPPTTHEAFNTIFTSQRQRQTAENPWEHGNSAERRPEDVIYTLHQTIENLESGARSAEDEGMRWEVIHESPTNSDGAKHLDDFPKLKSLDELVSQFRPFKAPPPPQPFPDAPDQAKASDKKAPRKSSTRGRPRQKTFTTTITVTESTDEDGQKTYSASSSPIVRMPDSQHPGREIRESAIRQPFLTRMYRRRLSQTRAAIAAFPMTQVGGLSIRRHEPSDARQQRIRKLYLISVKRQRKLKMKKHKYKKLMKRTRNLRRKLDRN